jgi:transcriptional regulator with XRE-family HTH domain
MIEKNKDVNQSVGERLRYARQELGMQGQEAAQKAFISGSLLSQLESGKKRISLDNLVRFSKLYKKDIIYFLKDFC